MVMINKILTIILACSSTNELCFCWFKAPDSPSWAIIIFRGSVKVSFKSDSIFLNPYFMVNFVDVV